MATKCVYCEATISSRPSPMTVTSINSYGQKTECVEDCDLPICSRLCGRAHNKRRLQLDVFYEVTWMTQQPKLKDWTAYTHAVIHFIDGTMELKEFQDITSRAIENATEMGHEKYLQAVCGSQSRVLFLQQKKIEWRVNIDWSKWTPDLEF